MTIAFKQGDKEVTECSISDITEDPLPVNIQNYRVLKNLPEIKLTLKLRPCWSCANHLSEVAVVFPKKTRRLENLCPRCF